MVPNSSPGMGSPMSASMMDRLMGVITLKAPAYRALADDTTATPSAAAIVIVVAVITGVISGLFSGNLVASLVTAVINALIGWLVGAFVLAFVAKTFFQGKTDTGEMLRVTGYASIFNLLGIIPIIGTFIGFILAIIAEIIGIREAAEIDTGKAILTGIIAFIIIVIVSLIIGLILGGVGLATGAITLPATPTP